MHLYRADGCYSGDGKEVADCPHMRKQYSKPNSLNLAEKVKIFMGTRSIALNLVRSKDRLKSIHKQTSD